MGKWTADDLIETNGKRQALSPAILEVRIPDSDAGTARVAGPHCVLTRSSQASTVTEPGLQKRAD